MERHGTFIAANVANNLTPTTVGALTAGGQAMTRNRDGFSSVRHKIEYQLKEHGIEPWMEEERMHEAGKKWDGGKPRFDLLPPDVIEDVVMIFTQGADKYGDRNWEKGMSYSRCYAAAHRHLSAFWQGEDFDPESGMHHISHAIVNLMFLRAYEMRESGIDDRRVMA